MMFPMRLVRALFLLPAALSAQQAESGFELRGTFTAQALYDPVLAGAPRNGSSVAPGFRAVLYPDWKLNSHWSFSGAIQTTSRPFDPNDAATQGYGIKTLILRAHATYSRVGARKSLMVRAGFLQSSFGGFLLRYDDAVNPLVLAPPSYGYYYKPVTMTGLAGAQVDATLGRFDFRAQVANASPANPRGIFGNEQHANWAGGLGFTLRQGFRLGASVYRGPYLDRDEPFFFPHESPPRELPATAFGIDGEWGAGHWNLYGEAQWFTFPYHVIPTFRENSAYLEARRTLAPRWYAAIRIARMEAGSTAETYEFVAAYRPNSRQLVKAEYAREAGPAVSPARHNLFALQLVTTFRAISLAHD
jgi:hypothetical protein